MNRDVLPHEPDIFSLLSRPVDPEIEKSLSDSGLGWYVKLRRRWQRLDGDGKYVSQTSSK